MYKIPWTKEKALAKMKEIRGVVVTDLGDKASVALYKDGEFVETIEFSFETLCLLCKHGKKVTSEEMLINMHISALIAKGEVILHVKNRGTHKEDVKITIL